LASQGYVTPGSAAYQELAAEVDNLRGAVDYSMQASEPEAAAALVQAYHLWWQDLGLVNEHLDRLVLALRAADAVRMPLEVLSGALQQASVEATHMARFEEAAAFADRLAALRDQHREDPAVRAAWAFAVALMTRYRADGDLSQVIGLLRESQQAYEDLGQSVGAAYAAGNIPLAAFLWDSVDGPEIAPAIKDCARLAAAAGAPNLAVLIRVLGRVIRVMGGANDEYASCLDAFAELEALDYGWGVAWGGLCVGVAAELVGDGPVATAHALHWVRFCRRSGLRNSLTCGIRAAARLSATASHPEQALRLWAGAEHVEAVTGLRYMPLMERLDRPLLQQCTNAPAADARLHAEGASWSVAEATQAAEEALLRLQADREADAIPLAPLAK
jgi:hypothetical protein